MIWRRKHRAVDVLASYVVILKFDWICLCVYMCMYCWMFVKLKRAVSVSLGQDALVKEILNLNVLLSW